MKHKPYTCIRCGYETPIKDDMRKHFYRRKKPCPCTAQVIDLTDEIKEWIIENRIYIPVKQPSVTQNINQYNTVMNFVVGMNPVQKVNKYFELKGIVPKCIQDKLDTRYKRKNENLENLVGEIHVDKDDIIEAVNVMTGTKKQDFSDYAIIHDTKLNKMSIYDGSHWMHVPITLGTAVIIGKLKEYHLDKYEQYLIRKLVSSNVTLMNKQKCKESLEFYYRFLLCFDLPPYVDSCDFEPDDIDKYMKMYNDLSNETTISSIRKLKTEISECIKFNGRQSVHDFNQHIMSIIQIDPDFAKQIQSNG